MNDYIKNRIMNESMKKQFLTTTIRPIDKTGEDFDLPSPNLLEGLPGLLDIIT
jgi:hypothetical protein